MSRTYNTKPRRLRYPRWDTYMEKVEYLSECTDFLSGLPRSYHKTVWLELAGVKPKKKRKQDTEDRWMTTPSWFTKLFMNRPQKRRGRKWETKIKGLSNLEDIDYPSVSKKPHKYFY